MATKKQQAVELAKTEARISGIPKGGSTRTGMTKAEKLASEAVLMAIPIGAAATLTKAASKIARSGKLGKSIAAKSSKKKKIQLAKKQQKAPKIEPQIRKVYDTGHRFGRKMPESKGVDSLSWEELKRAGGKEGGEAIERLLDKKAIEIYKRKAAQFHPEHPTVHNKGGYVKKYANGGSVRKVRR
jgi:hypothetical protein